MACWQYRAVSYDGGIGWAVVVPVKSAMGAKTRLSGLRPERRMALAHAFALDTVCALAAAPSVRVVLVMASDPNAVETFGRLSKVEVLVDRTAGMNEAVRRGVRWASRHVADAALAVIPGDLPAATPELFEVLFARAVRHRRGVLADMEMVGTTALTALRSTDLEPAFGPRSLRKHLRGGAVLLDAEGLEPLRRDVDLVEHLEAVLRLGAGGATRRAVAAESR